MAAVSGASSLSKESLQGVKERLSQWESKLAPLTNKQKDSYMSLAAHATQRPMPLDVSNGCFLYRPLLTKAVPMKRPIKDIQRLEECPWQMKHFVC